jgi:hypothetical protein
MIRDLRRLLKPEAKNEGDKPNQDFEKNWEKLIEDNKIEILVSHQITNTRQAVLSTIDSLD